MNCVRKRHLLGSVASVLTGLTLSVSMNGAACAASAADSASNVSYGSIVAQTVYLPLKNQQAAEARAQAIQTPGNPLYHKFLSVSDFVRDYAATDGQIAQVENILKQLGYSISYVFPNHLAIEVTSSAGTADNVLGMTLKRLSVHGRTGMAPSQPVTIPAALKGLVQSFGGLNTVAHARPHHAVAALQNAAPHASSGTLTGGTPGDYLPSDFAKFYGVNPLYAAGINGRGSTIGIVTLANYDPADAYSFWKQIGLTVSQSRITTVSVDGGTSVAASEDAGEGETDLDVEESGALAPSASLRVYVAPNNTNANFINGFEAAASENTADTVSSSWGQPELDFFADPAEGEAAETDMLDAFHGAFLEMALQGQTVFIASGDSGAFDTVRSCANSGTPSADSPVCNAPYSVDHPASDPLVTAAGGTTLPFSDTLSSGLKLTVDQERAWSWSYISTEAAQQGLASRYPVSSVFSTGDGGGVSSYWALPWYQYGVSGITKTKPGQTLTVDSGSGPVLNNTLPANFAGRNLPDLSANADPESGYQYISEGLVQDYYGGTSFVAPQLNGVTALFVQALGKRVGQLNPALYQLRSLTSHDITTGDNWGYQATKGYENATGVGTLDATRLLVGLAGLQYGFRL